MKRTEVDVCSVRRYLKIDFIPLPVCGSDRAAIMHVVKREHSRLTVHTPPQSCPVVSDFLSFDIAAEPNAFTCCHCNRESGCRHSEGWSVVLLYCARQCGGMAQILLKRVVVPGNEITHDLVRDDRCLHIEAGERSEERRVGKECRSR